MFVSVQPDTHNFGSGDLDLRPAVVAKYRLLPLLPFHIRLWQTDNFFYTALAYRHFPHPTQRFPDLCHIKSSTTQLDQNPPCQKYRILRTITLIDFLLLGGRLQTDPPPHSASHGCRCDVNKTGYATDAGRKSPPPECVCQIGETQTYSSGERVLTRNTMGTVWNGVALRYWRFTPLDRWGRPSRGV